MLLSLGLMLLVGMCMGQLSKKLHLPPLVGMIITGIVMSPYALDLIDDSVLNISSQLRSAALVIILTRAGLSLDIDDLKKAGRPALLMCFVPALFEICGTLLVAPRVFGISAEEALLLGSVLAAVSPAVVVPRMIKIKEENYGTAHGIPQIILAGASADDVFVLVLFSSFSALLSGGEKTGAADLIQIPTSIILGAGIGVLIALALNLIFRRFHMRDTAKVIVIISLSFIFMAFQDFMADKLRVSALIGIMAIGLALNRLYPQLASRLGAKYTKLWAAAEILLFVLVGAEINLSDAFAFGAGAAAVVAAAVIFRMAGVFVCMIKTKLTRKERLFCMMAYTPKATVQAAIGAVPLAMGLDCGQLILTCAVLSILITAPLGAFAIDCSYKKLLTKDMSA
ncbi:MAG: cation:proton antiporter [Huintestinicola sp.]